MIIILNSLVCKVIEYNPLIQWYEQYNEPYRQKQVLYQLK